MRKERNLKWKKISKGRDEKRKEEGKRKKSLRKGKEEGKRWERKLYFCEEAY